MASKDVTFSVSGMTITVTVTVTPTYKGITSIVTAKLLPNGPTFRLSGKEIDGGAQFQQTVQTPGSYSVNADCSGTNFPMEVTVPGSFSHTEHHTLQVP